MRCWKIGQIRDLIFDGSIIWIVAGRPRATRLIPFDPNQDTSIGEPAWTWRVAPSQRHNPVHQSRFFGPLVRVEGPPSCRTAMIPMLHRWMLSILHTELPDQREVGIVVGKTSPGQLASIPTGFVELPDAYTVKFDNGHNIQIERVNDGFRVRHSLHDDDFPLTDRWKYSSEPVATAHGVTHGPRDLDRNNSVGFSEFIGSDGVLHQSSDLLILDVAGDLRLERDRPTHATGSFVTVGGQKYTFVDRVYGGRISPDGLTAFVWGTGELVQFDLE